MKDPGVQEIRDLMSQANEIINKKIPGVEESIVGIELKLTPEGVMRGVGERTSWCNVLESKLNELSPIQTKILRLLQEGTMIPDEWLIKRNELEENLERDINRFTNR